MIDCHVHTARCGHAVGDLVEYRDAAEGLGVDVLAVTDHLPLPGDAPNDYSMSWAELPAYVDELSALRAASVGRPTEVLLGIEADWMPGRDDELRDVLGRHPFDVVLGSAHFIDGWAFDDPAELPRWGSQDVEAVWARYFELLEQAASTGLFDVMTHPDLVKKFGHRISDPLPLYESAARTFAEAGVAIEVNSAGLRKQCAEMYPSLRFLQACRRAGVLATFGSDAHAPSQVGSGWAEAREALVEAGYRSLVLFRGRRPEEVAL